MDLKKLGLSEAPSGSIFNDDPDYHPRIFFQRHLTHLKLSEVKRFGPRWAGVGLVAVARSWTPGSTPLSHCILSGPIYFGGPEMVDWDRLWEYPDLEAAKAALNEWDGSGEPKNFLTSEVA